MSGNSAPPQFWDENAIGIFGSDSSPPKLGALDQAKVAYALGLIGPIMLKDLENIAKIRNRFAHRVDVRSFDDDLVRDRVDNLETMTVLAGKINQGSGEKVHPPTNRRDRYVMTSWHLANCIWIYARKKPAPDQKPEDFKSWEWW